MTNVVAPAAPAPAAAPAPDVGGTSEALKQQMGRPSVPPTPPTTGAPTVEASKSEAAKTPEPIKPEIKYELKLPEGSVLSENAIEKTVAYAKARGLSNADAQAHLEFSDEAVKGYVEGQKTALKAEGDAWLEELKRDKEFGGSDLAKNDELAVRYLEKTAPDLKQALDNTGLGKYPPFFKLVVRMAKQAAEDKLILPSGQGVGKKSMEDLFYPPKKAEGA